MLKCKAAQTRHLASFALALALQHRHGSNLRPAYKFRLGSRLLGQEEAHLSNLVAMCEGLDSYVRSCALEPFSEDLCRLSMYKFLEALSALNRLWRENIP